MRLGELGYVGQEGPRRTLSLLAHRHVRRLRYIYNEAHPRDTLPPKENHLLVGPTGCGKTFAVELLFRDILELPTALIDITAFSETGYVGQDVSSLLTRLLYAADGDVPFAQVGVICIDEFDKIASGQNNAVFAGAGTTAVGPGDGTQDETVQGQVRTEHAPVHPFEGVGRPGRRGAMNPLAYKRHASGDAVNATPSSAISTTTSMVAIAAFSSTFMVWKDGEIDQLASQAAVEDFCMGLVKDLCEDRTP